MKTMKMLLIGVLFFGQVSVSQSEAQDINGAQYEGVVIPDFSSHSSEKKEKQAKKTEDVEAKTSQKKDDQLAEVELIRMISPDGNEVVFSLSNEVMGRSLKSSDFDIPGVNQAAISPLCQKTVSSDTELQRAELVLELELMIDDLRTSEKPRFLSGTQQSTLSKVPNCEMFRLQLTAISKMLLGYDYTGTETAQLK